MLQDIHGESEVERIRRLGEEHKYSELGGIGVLIEAYDKIGIPWDILVIYAVEEQDSKLLHVGLVTPPGENENHVIVHAFDPWYKFDRAYVEEAETLGYKTDSPEE